MGVWLRACTDGSFYGGPGWLIVMGFCREWRRWRPEGGSGPKSPAVVEGSYQSKVYHFRVVLDCSIGGGDSRGCEEHPSLAIGFGEKPPSNQVPPSVQDQGGPL
ncbi:hypothetical protein Pmar_PMAR024498 [Perkinsus marinus ATCC 50983]|uniref:Uncharacterized protein n=1 Tax=Perkinsus marinus (strain ATCC 50983 / TXsc) TaxID=423536 RepID=C5LT54_PERM5|nr:hypothetical protein Pmar_PMAR024498 [Perkinsus marinus ATCC 50983]EER00022.1 hypothetical protein Pmar_PMAR024498 [Perkinsus marinus ATCC 50983]|eukprot:XP_002767304.1 hypothetical protein Pmar_PMAR024498 [Perkinsus marinus ATCC 50983]